VAIGGIDRTNAALPIAAGAEAVAVISDIFAADDPALAAAQLRAIVHQALAATRA
jgi:thiamine-phosphate pyrophosphorylase